jgi:hypothetical protein
VLAGCLLEGFLPATYSLLLLTLSVSGVVDRNNSHIPLEICDSKLRALVAAQSAREIERTAPRSLRAHRSMRTAHHSARTAPRAALRAHRSAIPAPRAQLRAHSSARTAPLAQLRGRLQQCSAAGGSSASAGVLATGPRPHVPPAARMRVGKKAPPLISPLTNPLPPPSIFSGRVGGRKKMQLPAGPGPVQLVRLALRPPARPAPAACGQWSGRRTAARRPGPRPAGPARGCRPGQRLQARPAAAGPDSIFIFMV